MKKHKFTWIDALIIAVVAVLLAGTYVKFFVKDTTSVTAQVEEFTYQLRIEGLRQCSADSLQVGDKLYDNAGKGCVGEIAAIEVLPATTTYTDPDGIVTEIPIEDKFDVVLTVAAEGTLKDGVYSMGTYDIQVNHHTTYFTKYSIWSATVVAVN